MANQTFDKLTFFGCTLQSVSANVTSDNTAGNFTFTLFCEPGQEFQYENENPIDFLGNSAIFSIGSMNIRGKIVSVDKVVTDINGTGIYNVRLTEVGYDSIDLSDAIFDNILSFADIVSEHAGEILSYKTGSELIESDKNSGEAIFNIKEPTGKKINLTINLEVAGLPKTDIAKLLSPSLDTVSLGIAGVVFDELTSEQFQLSQNAMRLFSQEYPFRTRGIRQVQVQYSPNGGVRTRYSFTQYVSYLDSQNRDIRAALGAIRGAELTRLPNRDIIYEGFFDELGIDRTIDDSSLNEVLPRDELQDEMLEEIGRLTTDRLKYDLIKPTGGMGIIVGPAGGGPFYQVRRLSNIDIDPETFQRFAPGTFFLPEWDRVRNLAEPLDSPGYLLPGTQVTVQIYQLSELSEGVPFIEQSPQVFAPPIPGT